MTDQQTIIVSSSQIDNIQECPKIHYYSNILYISPIGDKNENLEKGDLLHYLLDLHYKSIILDIGLEENSIIELGWNHATKQGITQEQVEGILKLYSEYRSYYSDKGDWIPEESEVPFATVIYEDDDLRIILQGKIDLLVAHKRLEGLKQVVDHKYSSKNYPVSSRDTQNLSYCLATGRRDFILNQIGDQKTLPIEKRMQRYSFCYGEHKIEEFRNDVIYWTLEILRNHARAESNDHIPANRRACFKFGKPCRFFDLCETTADNLQYKIENEFISLKKGAGLFR